MKGVSELKHILGEHFDWNKARLDCFSRMLLALITVRTVNLREIAVAFASRANIDSRYKRLQRFFGLFHFDFTDLARWIFKLFFKPDDKFYLAIDRTNWYWGRSKVNIFLLSITYEGLSIPIFWMLLNKAGNSNFDERRKLILRFTKTFGSDCIQGILADREFASGKFFKWLNENKIPFYIRIKQGSLVKIHRRQKDWAAKKLFRNVLCKRHESYINNVLVFGVSVRLCAGRSQAGELMVIATNADVDNAVPIYIRRWEIENLFQSLKNRGFRFEDTHMIDPHKIEKLMGLLAVGFCWAHKVGEWRAQKKPIILKKMGNQLRAQFSYFRYGLDAIRDVLINTTYKSRLLRQFIHKLRPKNQLIGGDL